MEFIVTVFLFVVAILLIVKIGDAVKTRREEKKSARSAREAAEHDLARLARLEERIEVLERIMTDEQLEPKRRFRSF